MPEQAPRRRRSVLFVAIPVLIILLPFGYSVVSSVVAPRTVPSPAFLERPDPKFEECVKDTTYMRYHHWELLRGVREAVVRYGERGEPGLYECKRCHTSRERFCNQCHEAVSLYPDCFGCHYYP